MFEILFKRQAAVARHTAAPLLAERLRFLEHLQHVGAARKTLARCAQQMLCIGESFGWKFSSSVTAKQINAATDRWIRVGSRSWTLRVSTRARSTTLRQH